GIDSATTIQINQPPSTNNNLIRCTGTVLKEAQPGSITPDANGVYDSLGKQVAPASLYLAQLCERLGPSPSANIGYPAACSQPVAKVTPSPRSTRSQTGDGLW